LEIDKLLVRYLSSQTVTAQKLPYLNIGMDFAHEIFPLFFKILRHYCSRISTPDIASPKCIRNRPQPKAQKNLKKSKKI
jgi:hypothetical protein